MFFQSARGAAVILLALVCQPAFAHEVWLEPFEYHLAKSPLVRGHIRSGQMFSGSSQLYNPDKFVRFDSIHKGEVRKVKGRLGDLPAIKHKLKKPGLHSLVYQSTGNVISYPTWEKFRKFTDNEGVAWVQQAHIDRGLADQDFSEVFIRYAKALVTWKGSEGSDTFAGMPFEIVAMNDPYRENTDQLEIQVLWQGEPYPDAQLTVFRKSADGKTTRSIASLDALGKLSVPLTANSSILLNCVHMEPIDGKKKAPVWRSHWASITLEMPAK